MARDDQQRYSLADLTMEEGFALAYCRARIDREETVVRQYEALVKYVTSHPRDPNDPKSAPYTEAELRVLQGRGFHGLYEKGIVDFDRDGHRDLVPIKIHHDRIVVSAGGLITDSMQ